MSMRLSLERRGKMEGFMPSVSLSVADTQVLRFGSWTPEALAVCRSCTHRGLVHIAR